MPEGDITPQSQTPVAEPKKKINWKIISVISAIIIILLVVAIYVGFAFRVFDKISTFNKSGSSQSTPSSGVTIKKTTIKWPPKGSLCGLEIAKGSYLISYVYLPRLNQDLCRLNYNGRDVFSEDENKKLLSPQAISPNGLHYAYAVSTQGTDELYVDGNKVASADSITNIALTNSGNYFYTTGPKSNTSLVKNGKEIFHSAKGILKYLISDNGSTYLTLSEAYDPPDRGSLPSTRILSLNGKEIFKGKIEAMDLSLSANGKHYGFTNIELKSDNTGTLELETVFIDGKQKMKQNCLWMSVLYQVTNSGHYLIDCGAQPDPVWYLDGKFYSKSSTTIYTDFINPDYIYINEDASLILSLYQGGNWKLNGKPIDLAKPNPVYIGQSAEIDGNTIYDYEYVGD